MLIVVADDEPLIRMDAVGALTDAGFSVVEAGNAAEAIALLEANASSVHGLFTDVHMPGVMNGVALAHHTRRSWPWVVLLVASGQPLPMHADLPQNTHFLPKPYDSQHVVRHFKEPASATP